MNQIKRKKKFQKGLKRQKNLGILIFRQKLKD